MEPGPIWSRLGALSGLVFAVLLLAGLVIGNANRGGAQTPNPEQSSAEIARALIADRDESRLGSRGGAPRHVFLLLVPGLFAWAAVTSVALLPRVGQAARRVPDGR